MIEKGLVHIYCGDGKGKTTAAMGLILRCSGRGNPVVLVQFLKGQETGELESIKKLGNVTVLRSTTKMPFFHQMNEAQKKQSYEIHQDLLRKGFDEAEKQRARLLVLDEAIATYNLQLLDRELLVSLIKNRPAHLEVVLTGRDPDPTLVSLADYVSKIEKVKHPFDKGIAARDGIEK